MSYRNGISLGAPGILGVLFGLLMCLTTANADGIQEFVLSQLDGKGTVSSVNAQNSQIVIDDVLYEVSRTTTVFDVNRKKSVSLSNIKPGDSVGFRSKPLPKPTAPYDQSIIKMWILPSDD